MSANISIIFEKQTIAYENPRLRCDVGDEMRSITVVDLARDDCFAGANFRAGTAFDAGVGVDVVDFAFADGANGAYGLAGAASNAFVCNNVSHG